MRRAHYGSQFTRDLVLDIGQGSFYVAVGRFDFKVHLHRKDWQRPGKGCEYGRYWVALGPVNSAWIAR
jgi:hypothetical protein